MFFKFHSGIHDFRLQLVSRVYKSDYAGNSFNAAFIKKYKKLLKDYWNPNGTAKRFHEMNRLIVPLIYNSLKINSSFDIKNLEPLAEFQQIKVLDIGCGGGIISESLAKLNFEVVGIDPNPDLIDVAESHRQANKDLIDKSLSYHYTTLEKYIKTNREAFDVVIISDVLEHIPFWRKKQFLELCTSFCKLDGKIFITSLDESLSMINGLLQMRLASDYSTVGMSFFTGISERNLTLLLRSCGCTVMNIRGVTFNLEKDEFELCVEKSLYHFVFAHKRVLLL